MGLTRRSFLGAAAGAGAGLVAATPARAGGADAFGPLQPPDENGIRLPPGFVSRRLATVGQAVPGTSYVWPASPDGGATFATPDGGLVYTVNSEVPVVGGCSALRFDASGEIVDAYSILDGTSVNCAGGRTPWDTWISCEEFPAGRCFECDPFQPSDGNVREALGTFQHEAVAVDPVRGRLYLTEDQDDGVFYRLTPTAYPSIGSGTLSVMEVIGGAPTTYGDSRPVLWYPLVEPNPFLGGIPDDTGPRFLRATRYQVDEATPFDGAEGVFYFDDTVYFATKGDNRVWALDVSTNRLELIYDDGLSSNPILTGVDNVWVAPTGDVYVAEDGGDMNIVALTPSGGVVPVLQGPDIGASSEITGPALSPDGSRLYFSSQRGTNGIGATYEVRGPFTQGSVPLGGVAVRAAIGAGLLALARLRARTR